MLRTESFRKGILYSVLFNFFARGIAFLNAFVIAYFFGVNSETDLYFYILSFVTIVASFINGMDTYVLIPEAMRLRFQKDEATSMRFLNFFLYLYLFIGVILSLIIVANPTSLYFTISKFDYRHLSDNTMLLYFSALLLILVITTNLQAAIFTSYRFFTMPMIVSMVNNILSFVMILCLHDKFGINSGIIGMVGGYLLNFLFLLWYMKRKLNWRFQFSRPFLGPLTKKNLFFVQFSNAFLYLRNYVGVYLLSGLPSGTVASYNYGQQIASIPESIIFNQVGAVSSVKMNELYARKEYGEINSVFLKVSKALLFILVPISCIIFLYAYDIVYFLYARGKFDTAAVSDVSIFLKYLGFLMPFGVLMNMTSKLITSFQKINIVFYYNILINLYLIGLMIVGVRFYGVYGYLVAYLVGYATAVTALYYLLRHNIPEIEYYKGLKFFLLVVFVNCVITFIVFWVKYRVFDRFDVHFVIKAVLGVLLYSFLLYVISTLFKLRQYFSRRFYLT